MKNKKLIPLDPANIKLLVIHCTATKCNRPFTVEKLEACHKARFGQHGYHFLISRNGDIHPLLPENVRGCHARGYNSCSLGIAYEGGLDEKGRAADTRTALQKLSLYELLKELTKSYPQAKIIGHCELPHVAKDCPCFSMEEYKALQPENRH